MKQFLAALLLLLTSLLCHAQADMVHIVLSSDAEVYETVTEQLRKQLSVEAENTPSFHLYTVDEFNKKTLSPGDLIVTVGDNAATAIIKAEVNNTIIFGFIDDLVLSDYTSSNQWVATAITQPVQNLLSIADSLTAEQYKNDILILASDGYTEKLKPLLNTISLKHGKVTLLEIPEGGNPAKVIDGKLFSAAVLVAINDNKIWSGANARSLLYQAYKHKVPVVGYSKNFLKAGALVSAYSPISAVTDSTARLIKQWITHGHLLEEGIVYSDYRVEYNKNIARALKLTVPENQLIEMDK